MLLLVFSLRFLFWRVCLGWLGSTVPPLVDQRGLVQYTVVAVDAVDAVVGCNPIWLRFVSKEIVCR